MLCDYTVNPAASQPEQGDLWGVSTHGKNFPFGFSEIDDCWETYLLALTDHNSVSSNNLCHRGVVSQ